VKVSQANCGPVSTTARPIGRVGSSPAQWISKNARRSANCSGPIPTFRFIPLDEGIICSNGPCWSPDGCTLYFADTARRAIYAYDYDPMTGKVRSRRLFASFETLRGFLDGATVDEEGYVWSVEAYSGRLIRFDPMGVIDRIVGLPVQSTTSLTFGGANPDVAYVTSMARPMSGQYHRKREAGCLFKLHGLGVRGLPEPRFAG
jgi:sugar lactone lactonase YvrE